jgi:hypothetical protein
MLRQRAMQVAAIETRKQARGEVETKLSPD